MLLYNSQKSKFSSGMPPNPLAMLLLENFYISKLMTINSGSFLLKSHDNWIVEFTGIAEECHHTTPQNQNVLGPCHQPPLAIHFLKTYIFLKLMTVNSVTFLIKIL